MRDNQDPK